MSSARSASTSLVWMVGLAVIGLVACNQTSGLQSPATDVQKHAADAQPPAAGAMTPATGGQTTPATDDQASPATGGDAAHPASAAPSDSVAASRFEDAWRRFVADAGKHYNFTPEQMKFAEGILQNCLTRASRSREQYEKAAGGQAQIQPSEKAKRSAAADLEKSLIKLNDELIGRVVSLAPLERVEQAADAGFKAPPFMDPSSRPEVGYQAPPFKLSTAEGKAVELDALYGKVVVLHFWASWCGYCKKALPEIQKLYEATKDNPRVKLYGINCRQRPGNPDPSEVLKQNGCTYPQLVSGDPVGTLYEAKSFPVLFIIGPDGKILNVERGFKTEVKERLVPIIEKALRQADAQKPAA